MISVQAGTLPLILIFSVVNTEVSLIIYIYKLCIFHFRLWVQIAIAIYTARVIKLYLLEDEGLGDLIKP